MKVHLDVYGKMREMAYRETKPGMAISSFYMAACAAVRACAAQKGVELGINRKMVGQLRWRKGILGPYVAEVRESLAELEGLSEAVAGDKAPNPTRAQQLFEVVEKRCLEILPPLRPGFGGPSPVVSTGKPRADLLKWALPAVRFFRGLGFLGSFAGLSDEELARRFCSDVGHESMWKNGPPKLADLHLLASDESRVWWGDPEADVCTENEVYRRVLPEWGRISRGTFSPQDVTEAWGSERGPITVEFTHSNARHALHPRYLDDYIDTGILGDINHLIAGSGFRYWVYNDVDYQSTFITVLSPEEKALLERERSWRLIEPQ